MTLNISLSRLRVRFEISQQRPCQRSRANWLLTLIGIPLHFTRDLSFLPDSLNHKLHFASKTLNQMSSFINVI